MNTAVEREIIRTLSGRTGGAVDVTALRVNAVTRARRVRRRRRIGACLLAVALLAGAGAVVSLRDGEPRERSAGRTDTVPPKLPALDVPGATERPDTVATDPSVIHFDVDAAALGATELLWRSVWSQESVTVRRAGDPYELHFSLARDEFGFNRGYSGVSNVPLEYRGDADRSGPFADQWRGLVDVPLPVAGAPGIVRAAPTAIDGALRVHSLTWSPAPGLFARLQMVTDNPANLERAAKAFRMDRSQRCAAPAAVSGAPPDARFFECEVSLRTPDPDGSFWNHSILTFSARSGNYLDVIFGKVSIPQPFTQNRTVNGRPARWHAPDTNPDAMKLDVPGEPGRDLVVSVRSWNFTEPEATRVAEAFRWVGDPRDLRTWPARSVQ